MGCGVTCNGRGTGSNLLGTECLTLPTQNPYFEAPTLKVMALRGRRLREVQALISGVSTLIKGTPESSVALPNMWGHSKQEGSQLEEGLPQNTTMPAP